MPRQAHAILTETLCNRVFTISHEQRGRDVRVVHRIDGKRIGQDAWIAQREIESRFARVHKLLRGEV